MFYTFHTKVNKFLKEKIRKENNFLFVNTTQLALFASAEIVNNVIWVNAFHLAAVKCA